MSLRVIKGRKEAARSLTFLTCSVPKLGFSRKLLSSARNPWLRQAGPLLVPSAMYFQDPSLFRGEHRLKTGKVFFWLWAWTLTGWKREHFRDINNLQARQDWVNIICKGNISLTEGVKILRRRAKFIQINCILIGEKLACLLSIPDIFELVMVPCSLLHQSEQFCLLHLYPRIPWGWMSHRPWSLAHLHFTPVLSPVQVSTPATHPCKACYLPRYLTKSWPSFRERGWFFNLRFYLFQKAVSNTPFVHSPRQDQNPICHLRGWTLSPGVAQKLLTSKGQVFVDSQVALVTLGKCYGLHPEISV